MKNKLIGSISLKEYESNFFQVSRFPGFQVSGQSDVLISMQTAHLSSCALGDVAQTGHLDIQDSTIARNRRWRYWKTVYSGHVLLFFCFF